jgi:hypothetical protein
MSASSGRLLACIAAWCGRHDPLDRLQRIRPWSIAFGPARRPDVRGDRKRFRREVLEDTSGAIPSTAARSLEKSVNGIPQTFCGERIGTR